MITEQNKKNIFIEERIKQLEDIVNEYKKEKAEKEKENLFFYETEILNKEAKDMLLSWLPRKPIKLTLLLNSNKDGHTLNTFLEKVNAKCPTLIVIKTTNGHLFGGYTTQLWKDENKAIRDENAFVFSIDKKKNIILNNQNEQLDLIKINI